MDRDQLEKMTKEYQLLQDQLQSLAMQKEQFSAQKEDYKQALAEIEKTTGKIYLAVGGAMVDVNKETALKDVKDRQESAEMRLGIANKQYDELSKREQILRSGITAALKELKQA
jgi:prefoldin beta subunit